MTTSATNADPVKLWYTRCGAATASALAIRKNWLQAEFSKPGTELLSLRESDSLDIRNSHYHHRQSGMFREGGNIPPIWAKGQGQDTVVVGITWIDEYQGVLTRADSRIKSVADLKGKRLGIPLHKNAVIDFQRGAAQHGFVTALSLAGLAPLDATLVDIPAPSYDLLDGPRRIPSGVARRQVEIEALERGEVDAVFIRFAEGVRHARNPRFHEVININTIEDRLLRVNNGTPRPVTVDRAFLGEHRDIVVRYLAVLLRTAAWAASHHEEVIALLAPEDGGGSLDEVLASHGAEVHKSFTPTLTSDYIEGLNVQKNFLRDWGYIKHDFDVHDWIDPSPLVEARNIVNAENAQASERAA